MNHTTLKISTRFLHGEQAPSLDAFTEQCRKSLPANKDWKAHTCSATTDGAGNKTMEMEFFEVIHLDTPETQRLRVKLHTVKAMASIALLANSGVRDDVRSILTQIKDTEL